MTDPEAILQLARLTGRDEFLRRLQLDAGRIPPQLDADQRRRLTAWIDEQCEALVQGLLDEAMACDDVQDAGSACAYLEDRLRFLNDLLSAAQQQRVREQFARVAQTWT
jgi:hypothetical protein